MLTSFLAADILTSARAAILRDSADTQVLDTSLLIWANEELRKLWALVARVAPGVITKTKTFTVASGNTQIITSISGLTDYWLFRGLDFDYTGSGDYSRIKPTHFQARYRESRRGFLLYGTTLELYPKVNATGPYQLWYLYTAPTMAASGSLSLPIGSDEFIAQGVAAKARGRFSEDPSQHLTAGQQGAWEGTIRPALASMSAAVAAPMADVDDGDDW